MLLSVTACFPCTIIAQMVRVIGGHFAILGRRHDVDMFGVPHLESTIVISECNMAAVGMPRCGSEESRGQVNAVKRGETW